MSKETLFDHDLYFDDAVKSDVLMDALFFRNYKKFNYLVDIFLKENKYKNEPDKKSMLEAPHRIEDTLQDMLDVLGNRQMCLARELTKVHEEYIRGTIQEVLEVAATCKGEMVIIMDGFKQDEVVFDMYTAISKVDEYIESGMRTKEAIGLVAKEMACKKNELYEAYHKR